MATSSVNIGAGASAAPAGDMLSMVQSALGSESQSIDTNTDESTPDESSTEVQEASTDPAPDQAVSGTENTDEAQNTDQQTVEQTDDENDTAPPDVPGLTQTRWEKRSAAYRWGKELAKAFGVLENPDKEALDVNLLPPIEELVQGREALADQVALQHDFASADPRNAETFIRHWNDTSPQGMAAMASRLADVLADGYTRHDGTYAQPNTAAYTALATPVLNRYLQARIGDYKQAPQGPQKEALYYSIQQIHHDLTGEWMKPEQLDVSAQTQDPLASERQALSAERQQIQNWQAQQAQQQFATRKNGIDSALGNVVTEGVKKALSAHEKTYEPVVLSAITNDLARTVQQDLATNNETNRIFQVQYERALRSGDQAAIDDLVKRQSNRVETAIRKHAPKYISQATRTLVANSEARHEQLRQAEAKRGPNGAAAPRPQSVAGALQRQPGESNNEFMRRELAHKMGQQ